MAGNPEHIPLTPRVSAHGGWRRPDPEGGPAEHVPLRPEPAAAPAESGLTPPVAPAAAAPSGGHLMRNGLLVFLLSSLLFVGVSGFLTWRWVDGHLLHWGVKSGETRSLNGAELLQQVRAFELATVKQTYAAQAHVDASKVLNAGPKKIDLPGWVDGQKLDAKGNVIITAGVDLAKVKPEDMEVTREGKDTHVTIHLPPSEVLSSELVPNTLDTSTSSGLFSRLRQSIGLSDKDLRNQAADQVTQGGRDAAIQQGILDTADRESERRLQSFLQSLPQPSGGGHITYTVIVAAQPRQ